MLGMQSAFQLGEFVVHPAEGTLEGPLGSVHLEPKLIAVLLYLVQHPGEVVGRQAILDEVWQQRVVTDDALTRCISELRTALGDDRSAPVYIKTIPKRGYCLLIEPRPVASSPSTPEAESEVAQNPLQSTGRSSPAWKHLRPVLVFSAAFVVLSVFVQFLFLAGINSKPKAVHTSVAVLPFRVAWDDALIDNPDPALISRGVGSRAQNNGSYYSEGIEEELRTALMQIDGLSVAPASVSRDYHAGEYDPSQAGRNLEVGAILTGTIDRSQEDFKMTLQLIDTATGVQIWSGMFERRSGQLFDLQTTIANQVARAFTLEPPAMSSVARISSDLKALDYYLLGRHYWNRRDPESLQQAVLYFRRAIQTDPRFALAYSGLADSFVLLADSPGVDETTVIAEAQRAVEAALELQPALAEAHASLGILRLHQHQSEAAEAALEQAVALNPHYSMGLMWLGNVHMWRGNYLKAYNLYERAYRADPGLPVLAQNLINASNLTGRYEISEKLLAENLSQSEPRDPMFLRLAAGAALEQAQYEKASRFARQLVEMDGFTSEGYLALARIAWEQGRESATEDYLQRAEAASPGAASVYFSRLEFLSRTPGRVSSVESAIELWHARHALPFDELTAMEHFFLGLSKIREGDVAGSVAHLRSMLEADLGPEYLVARIMSLGYLVVAARELEDTAQLLKWRTFARRLVEQADGSGLNSYPYQIQRAFLLAALGDEQKAVADFGSLLDCKAIDSEELGRDLRSRRILDHPALKVWLGKRVASGSGAHIASISSTWDML